MAAGRWYEETLFDGCMDWAEYGELSALRREVLASITELSTLPQQEPTMTSAEGEQDGSERGKQSRAVAAAAAAAASPSASALTPRILEVGLGGGLNLPQYPCGVRELHTLTLAPEPSPRARRKARAAGISLRHAQGDGATLPYPDQSFHVVVATLILCSVRDRDAFVREVFRVLKPGGAYCFLDHAWAPDDRVSRGCRAMAPLHRRLALGCHMDRVWRTEPFARAGFDMRRRRESPPATDDDEDDDDDVRIANAVRSCMPPASVARMFGRVWYGVARKPQSPAAHR